MMPLAPRYDDHRAHLAALRAAALAAADPAAAVRRWLAPADFAGAENIYLVGAGKAALGMALAAAELIGPRLTAGVVAVTRLPAAAPQRLSIIEGGHPDPTAGSLTAGRALEAMLSQTTARDLVVALVSGGGSAMLELPRPGLSLADLQAANAALLKSGAAVDQINLVRTQLSQLKGGGLARLAHPARVLALILSDVVGSPLAAIASGPTVVPAMGGADGGSALAVVERYGLREQLPPAVLQALAHGTGPLAAEAPRVENRLIGSNRLAAEAAVAAARKLGFETELAGDDWQGEARLVGRRFARLVAAANTLPGRERPGPAFELAATARCLIAGGESTVSVRGAGKGGRNQEAALAAAMLIDGQPGLAIGTFATDGVDGPTDAAGAVVTGETLPRARALGLDPQQYLDDNDSYSFFARAGGLLITGPTGTNVNDLMFGLAY